MNSFGFKRFLQIPVKQLNGLFVLVMLIFVLFLMPELYFKHFFKNKTFSEAELATIEQYFLHVDSLQMVMERNQSSSFANHTNYQKSNQLNANKFSNSVAYNQKETLPQIAFEPFVFNPNDPDSLQWLKLQLKPRQILTIKNYLKKGGKFRYKEDFKKIYGLSEHQYLKLEPYIDLPKRDAKNDSVGVKNTQVVDTHSTL